jgi:hypothetical protein
MAFTRVKRILDAWRTPHHGLPTELLPLVPIEAGHDSAGNGGNGHFSGYMIDSSYAALEPLNLAVAGAQATAVAHQTNLAYCDQAASQIAGIVGHGGDAGGNVRGFGSAGPDAIATGDNGAGDGGNDTFCGEMLVLAGARFVAS